MFGAIGKRFLDNAKQQGFHFWRDAGGEFFVRDAHRHTGAPAELLRAALQRGNQTRVVEQRRTQIGAELADADDRVGQQFARLAQQLAAFGIGSHRSVVEGAQVQANCRKVGAGTVVQLNRQAPSLFFLCGYDTA